MASVVEVNAAAGVRFHVLGPIAAARDGEPLDLGSPQQRLTLALLLSDFGALRSTGWLVDGIWGETPPTTARKTLQVYVSHLRDTLGADCIEFDSGGYRVASGRLDAAIFEERLAAGRRLVATAPDEAAEELAASLALWNGSPYSGFEDISALRAEIDRLEELRTATVEERIAADLEAGGASALVGELESLVREYPWHERFCAQLMMALYRSGRQADALQAYRRTRDRLVEELGIEPGPELEDLQRRILQHDPALISARQPTAAESVRAIRGYELREELTSGTTASVYRAFDRGTNQPVAIKVVAPETANRSPYLDRFEPTAQLLMRLNHPHIVRLDDHWRDPDGAYLVSAWMPGGNLRSALGGGRPWAGEAALTLIGQIGSALGYAHRNGVIHGGVKPENVLFDDAGAAHLGDFPVVPGLTGPYVAPELARPEQATPASDIYAFGLLLHELLTGSLPKHGKPSRLLSRELQEVVTRAIAREPRDRFERAEDLVRAVRQATGSDVVAVAEGEPSIGAIRNPYKGLRAFTEADAGDFFGRAAMTQRLLDAASGHRLLAVVGPSGCGKSSLVRAGLVHELRSSARGRPVLVTEMFPGRHPFEELEVALRRVAVGWPEEGMVEDLRADADGLLRAAERVLPADDHQLVLVVDQFEELFSLVEDEEQRARFLQCLTGATRSPDSRVLVVITLRADFFDRPLAYADFGALLEQGLVPLAAPSRRELAQAVRGPATRVGLELEDGLVSEIVSDVADQPGALPLMEFALTELVARGDGRRLTLEGYRHLGGAAGAVGSRAEEVYRQQPEAGQAGLQQALLRLVHVDDERATTRRRIRRSELSTLAVDQAALSAGLQAFAAHRLLTFDRDPITRGATVEVAHEALLQRWPRLRGWVDDRRQDLMLHHRLGEGLLEWLANGSQDTFLLSGGRLEQLAAWRETSRLKLTGEERDFLDQSLAVERQRKRRGRRLRIGIGAVAATLLTVGALFGVLALQQRSATEHAEIQRLARTAMSLASSNPEQSLLIALAAADQARAIDGTVPDAVAEALHAALMNDRLEATIPQGGLLALSPDGTRLVIGDSQGKVTLWDPGTATRIGELPAADRPLQAMLIMPDGDTLVGLDGGGTLERWDLASGSRLSSLDTHQAPVQEASWLLAVSPDGTQIVVGNDKAGTVTIMDAGSGNVVAAPPIDNPTDAAFDPAGGRLAVSTASGSVTFFDAASWKPDGAPWRPPTQTPINRIEWSPSPGDARLAVATQADGTMVLDAEHREVVQTIPGVLATAVHFDASGNRLVIVSQAAARVVDATSGAELAPLSGHAHAITNAAFGVDGSHVITSDPGAAGIGGTTRIWDIRPTAQREVRTIQAGAPGRPAGFLAFSGDGSLLLTTSLWGKARVWDTTTWQPTSPSVDVPTPIGQIAVSPDDTSFAVAQGESAPGWTTIFDPRLATHPTQSGIFDLNGRLLTPAIGDHPGTVLGRAYSPDGQRLVTAGRGGVINLWDLGTRRALDSQVSGHGGMNIVSFNADGTAVVAGNDDGTFTLWSTADDRLAPIRTVHAHAGPVFATFSPDGKQIATASTDGTGAVWTLDGQRQAQLTGHTSVIWDLVWTPDGANLVTVSLDGTIRVWDARSGSLRMTIAGVGLPAAVSVSPDGLMAVPSGNDGRVFLYTLDSNQLVRIARERTTRSLTPAECHTFAIDPCPT